MDHQLSWWLDDCTSDDNDADGDAKSRHEDDDDDHSVSDELFIASLSQTFNRSLS